MNENPKEDQSGTVADGYGTRDIRPADIPHESAPQDYADGYGTRDIRPTVGTVRRNAGTRRLA